ncbi:MAG: DJ-1/PfpI family protein [Chitinispirillaceae bacterium]|nr:DJ-1/PfpI family protein [Chitinispirillaceae bacterium]
MTEAIVLLADGFEEVEALTVVDLLRRADIKVTTVSIKDVEVKGGHNIIVKADTTLEKIPSSYDALILPGGAVGTKNLLESEKVISMVRETFEKGLICAAICAAPQVLGKAGILKERKATCYPGCEEGLKGAIIENKPVVRDKNIITSRGVGTAIAFALEIICVLKDENSAKKISSQILYSN